MKLRGCVPLLVLCLTLFTTSAMAFNVLAGLFSDRSCTALLAPPMGLDQGVCAYSEEYNFYYNISTTTSGQARFNFGCRQGCVGCAEVGTTHYGSCLRFQLGGNELFATAWRVDSSALLAATIYADSRCARQLPYGSVTVQSGSCVYSPLLHQSVVAAQLDARDSPKSEQIAYGLNCNQQCGYCSAYNRTADDLCTPVFNVYMKIKTLHV